MATLAAHVPHHSQVAYVERVNAELSEALERCDADALAAQVGTPLWLLQALAAHLLELYG